jgi:hypothetical protein
MAKKFLWILLLSGKMYGMWWGYRALEAQEEYSREESEKIGGRMDWWAPQNELATKHLIKCMHSSRKVVPHEFCKIMSVKELKEQNRILNFIANNKQYAELAVLKIYKRT